jgi:hypothetical protein
MQDRELIQMAAFKLHETARRLESLARESNNMELRKRFRALAAELVEREKQLRQTRTFDTARPTASAASRFASRVRRRAAG